VHVCHLGLLPARKSAIESALAVRMACADFRLVVSLPFAA